MIQGYEDVLERLGAAGIVMDESQQLEYVKTKDDLGVVGKEQALPIGYKRCGKCSHGKKFYLFNRNSGSKTNTSGNCKNCQKSTAKKSYNKTKQKRNYKKYYQENKEAKQEQARKYYAANKDKLKEKHKIYVRSKKGRAVMQKAHAKRRKSMAENAGVPYTRELVIIRDGEFLGMEHPVCYLCEKPITDVSGAGLHIDHVVPIATEGLDCFTNVACTHAACNLTREKDARDLLPSQTAEILVRAKRYMDEFPETFEV